VSVGAVGCFAVSAASYVPFIAVALWILPHAAAHGVRTSTTGGLHLLSGVREVIKAPQLRGALLTVFATSILCGPLITFAPVLVKEVFHGGASQFSLAIGAFGVGGLIGAGTLLFIAATADRGRLGSCFAVSCGVVTLLVALSPWAIALPALLVMAGLTMSVSNTAANTLVQAIAPPTLRGQTVSLYMLAVRGGMSLGGLLTGMSIGWVGVRHALLINGAMAIAVQPLLARTWWRPAGSMGASS